MASSGVSTAGPPARTGTTRSRDRSPRQIRQVEMSGNESRSRFTRTPLPPPASLAPPALLPAHRAQLLHPLVLSVSLPLAFLGALARAAGSPRRDSSPRSSRAAASGLRGRILIQRAMRFLALRRGGSGRRAAAGFAEPGPGVAAQVSPSGRTMSIFARVPPPPSSAGKLPVEVISGRYFRMTKRRPTPKPAKITVSRRARR